MSRSLGRRRLSDLETTYSPTAKEKRLLVSLVLSSQEAYLLLIQQNGVKMGAWIPLASAAIRMLVQQA